MFTKGNPNNPKIYLAGPFFNPQQVKIIEGIEYHLKANNFSYFSPSGGYDRSAPPPRIENEDQAQEVYAKNEYGMLEADVMIAVGDYVLPPGAIMMLMRKMSPEEEADYYTPYSARMVEIAEKGGMKLPDSGTVFEMGFFRALRKPIILYRQEPGGTLNLMLTAPLKGVVYGMDNLARLLRGLHGSALGDHPLNYTALEGWQGGFI